MSKRLFKTLVALLAIAAMATGPARAQSNTVGWEKYQISEFNLMQGDRETLYDVTITCNDGTAGDNGGDVSFNGAFTFSVPAGSVFTQIVIRDETWLGVDDNNTGWSRDEHQTQATWTGNARSVACQITASNVQYIEFTIAPAVPKMYTSEVSITDLVPGDTLVEGATIIGSGNDEDMVFLNAGRTKKNGVVQSYWENLGLPPTVIGTNGTISGTYTPVDENGQDGKAWVVTSADLNDYDGFQVGLGGIRIPVPITVRKAAGTEEAGNWSLASGDATVSGTAVLGNVMSGSQVTATYGGSRKVKSVKAVKYVAPAATVATAPTAAAAIIEVGSTEALVNAGTANGGTMMYAVTTTNTKPTSTDGFSATVPTAEGRTAGTYYVWYYAKADADHSDSEIAGPVSVTLPVMYTVTWNSSNVFNSDNEDDRLNKQNQGTLIYADISISFSGSGPSSFYPYDDSRQTGMLQCFGNLSDSFTFTAPLGKKFYKIEIVDNETISFTNYGDWTRDMINKKFVWSGTAASTVTLGGTAISAALSLNRIVFTLIDAQ